MIRQEVRVPARVDPTTKAVFCLRWSAPDNEEFEDEADRVEIGNDFDGHKEQDEDDEEEPPKKKACANGSSYLKTKNSRPKNPRGAVGGAIVSLVKQMGKNSSNNSMVGMMKMMMQQQQQSNNQCYFRRMVIT